MNVLQSPSHSILISDSSSLIDWEVKDTEGAEGGLDLGEMLRRGAKVRGPSLNKPESEKTLPPLLCLRDPANIFEYPQEQQGYMCHL